MTGTAAAPRSKETRRKRLNLAATVAILLLAAVLPYFWLGTSTGLSDPISAWAITIAFFATPLYFVAIIIAEVKLTRRARRELPDTLPERWVPYLHFASLAQLVGSVGQILLITTILLSILALVFTLFIAAFFLILFLPAFFGLALATMIATLFWRLSYGAHVAEAWAQVHDNEDRQDLLYFNRLVLYIALGLGMVATGLLGLVYAISLVFSIAG